jgi:site-specific DNA-cytosine methylase
MAMTEHKKIEPKIFSLFSGCGGLETASQKKGSIAVMKA